MCNVLFSNLPTHFLSTRNTECSKIDRVEKLNYRQPKSPPWPRVSRRIINEQVQVVRMCLWRVMSTKMINREYFMESAGVRYLHTICWRIRTRTSERNERMRFLIQKRVGKYRTKHFTCGIVFIIYILRHSSFWWPFYFKSFKNAKICRYTLTAKWQWKRSISFLHKWRWGYEVI